MSTSLLLRMALATIAAVALFGAPSPAPVAEPAPPSVTARSH